MHKIVLIFFLISAALLAQAQTGFCKITKVSPDHCQKSKLTLKFVNPQGKPATSHVAFKMNNDTVIQPKIDKTGTYEMTLEPGTYNFNFFVKYWHDVNSKAFVLKPKTNTFLIVKFEAVEIGSTPVK